MNTNDHRATAHRFFDLFTAGQIDEALQLATSDFTWRIPGKRHLTPSAGTYQKEEIRELFHRMKSALVSGLTMTVVSTLAEGDRVSIEATSSGDLKNGRRYRQEYHLLMEFRDGLIAGVREYLDTQHAHDVWFAKTPVPEPKEGGSGHGTQTVHATPPATVTEDHMSPKEVVSALYRAYASHDPHRISALLHPDIVWVAPPRNATQVALGLGQAEDAGPPNGSNNLRQDEIVDFMAHNFSRLFQEANHEITCITSGDDRVVAEHRLSAKLPNGRPYVNDYCLVYEVDNGKVRRIREYMDTRGGWAQVFADEAPGTMIEFVRP